MCSLGFVRSPSVFFFHDHCHCHSSCSKSYRRSLSILISNDFLSDSYASYVHHFHSQDTSHRQQSQHMNYHHMKIRDENFRGGKIHDGRSCDRDVSSPSFLSYVSYACFLERWLRLLLQLCREEFRVFLLLPDDRGIRHLLLRSKLRRDPSPHLDQGLGNLSLEGLVPGDSHSDGLLRRVVVDEC